MKRLALPLLAVTACSGPKHAEHQATTSPPASSSAASSGVTVFEIDLTSGIGEAPSTTLFRRPRPTFTELVAALAHASANEKVRAFFVRLGSVRLGWARTQELARTLRALRNDGRIVYCHADELSNATAWLTAEGCTRVFLSPAGSVDTVGIAAEMIFVRELLEKLGVKAEMLQIGRYKGTGEMLTRSFPSAEVKASVQGALSDIRATWLEHVTTSRPAATGLEAGPYTPAQAKTLNLIDEAAYVDEARQALLDSVGAKKTEPLLDRNASGSADIIRVLTGARKAHGAGPIAVIRAAGAISLERARGFSGDEGIDRTSLERLLSMVRKDDTVKAVVLRIDSPGGSALASDLLWHDLMLLRKQKPLVVSIGDMAASGGYYLASAGTKIVAEATSIVGSIGVVGGKVALGPFAEQHGVHVEPVPAVAGADPSRAVYMSAFTPWDDATRERVYSTMQHIYDLFEQRVAEGRSLSREKVQEFAEGRIWSGSQGLALGMVDELGGLSRAVDVARMLAGLPSDVSVRIIDDHRGLLGMFDDEEPPDAHIAVMHALLPTVPTTLLPFARLCDAYAPLALGEKAVLAAPFALSMH